MTDYQGARVCIYARASATRRTERDAATADQVEGLKIWCKKNGAVIADIVVEPATSAAPDGRSRFQAVIAAATSDKRPYDVILVDSPSRLFRNPKALVENLAMLKRSKVDVVSITQTFADVIPG